MLLDTHCHLDAPEFDADRQAVIQRALEAGVAGIVIPAVEVANFSAVRHWAHQVPGGAYALGIHPLYVPRATEHDLHQLEHAVVQALDDPRFVGLGEIGLDFFVPELCTDAMRARQEHFYERQLGIARRYALPVLLHVRKSHDRLLKYLRAGARTGGIAHAFNGSFQQARAFIEQGFALGFGGTVTFERSLQIRRLAVQLPLAALVLETDAPDIAPSWVGGPGMPPGRNEPAQVAAIARVVADLRGLALPDLLAATTRTACTVLPRLAACIR